MPYRDLIAELEHVFELIAARLRPIKNVIRGKDGFSTFKFRLAYAYLRQIGVADEFVRFCEQQNLYPDYTLIRMFYYARNVVGLMAFGRIERPASFLEVGAGAAAMAIILHRLGVVRRYVIVDLPEMLACSAYHVERHLPGVRVHFGPPEGEEGFTFVTPDEARHVCGSIDASLNFVSFAEMEANWVEAYFDLIYRISRPGALHYNVNRTHQYLRQSDGSHFYNHPLLYPYRSDDDVTIWDLDPLQDVSRSWGLARPRNPGYARAAFLHGTGRRRLMPPRAFERHSLASLLEEKHADWIPWELEPARVSA